MVWAFAALVPGQSGASTAATLCLAFAVGCVLAALAFQEPFRTATLNRWHEAAGFVIIALILHYAF